MRTEKKRFAKIKANAHNIFWKRVLKDYNVELNRLDIPLNRQIPQTVIDFRKKLGDLANMEMEITKEYNDRIVLKYPPELVKPFGEGKIVGIDLEKDLVKIIER